MAAARRAGGLVVIALSCSVVGACAAPTLSLSDQARRVMLLRYEHNRGPEVEHLGRVSCVARLDGRGPDANAIACETHLLNEAAEMGGDIVVVEMMRIDEDSAKMIGQVYVAAEDEDDAPHRAPSAQTLR